jgi:hypothetical protein
MHRPIPRPSNAAVVPTRGQSGVAKYRLFRVGQSVVTSSPGQFPLPRPAARGKRRIACAEATRADDPSRELGMLAVDTRFDDRRHNAPE